MQRDIHNYLFFILLGFHHFVSQQMVIYMVLGMLVILFTDEY